MAANELSKVKLTLANPTGLGLFGLAIVTLVASSQKLGITTGSSLSSMQCISARQRN